MPRNFIAGWRGRGIGVYIRVNYLFGSLLFAWLPIIGRNRCNQRIIKNVSFSGCLRLCELDHADPDCLIGPDQSCRLYENPHSGQKYIKISVSFLLFLMVVSIHVPQTVHL